MKQYVLFGGGVYAEGAIQLLGRENIKMILDNDPSKWGTELEQLTICSPMEKKEELADYTVVVSVSKKYQQQIVDQLKELGVASCRTIQDVRAEKIRERRASGKDYISVYNKAIHWIQENTIDGQAIAVCAGEGKKAYPEVTGYYIQTLIWWGYRELALAYGKWLCSIQKEDGSWYDSDDKAPYVFDSAQILKGLLAIRDVYPQADQHIKKGCDWILGNMQESGRLTTPCKDAWGSSRVCSELIHLYCLSPLVEAAEVYGMSQYKDAAYKILNYYKSECHDEIMNFNLLSHFYAYVMEGLLDMGEKDMVCEAMEKVAVLQKDDGAVPGYKDVSWVCSTGLFQFSLIWFRLGDVERGNKAFAYACSLQNESGGWYGSYLAKDKTDERNDYFPNREISWAVKFFLDALHYKNLTGFNLCADIFINRIGKEDGRYQIINDLVSKACMEKEKTLKVLDVGCGKGRYLKNLLEDKSENEYYTVDLSVNVMKYIESERVVKKEGSLTYIDYPDEYFDVVYTCEALGFAIDTKSVVREMARVTKRGGRIAIIDKTEEELGRMELMECEQWFDINELKRIMSEYCSKVEVIKRIDYEQEKNDNLFFACIGVK